jgi:PPK2 family polyphosphate:nucleotide phosphotransferase
MDYRKQFVVKPGHRLNLSAINPSEKGEHAHGTAAAAETEHYSSRLSQLQSLLYADRRHAMLIALQALDAGGKDGTIKHVFHAVNPQGVKVVSFKQPTPLEQAHDFLWRVHPHTPARGEIAIFNRSHYEDVLITRVHKLIDKKTWTARFGYIRQFETALAASGTTILKFFLHIDKDEQLARFAERLHDPDRNWKISDSDYAERDLWDSYTAAFEDAISETSTAEAPWFVIPANHKWFRNLAISQIVVDTLAGLGLSYPAPSVDLAAIGRKYHEAVAAAAKSMPGRRG